MAIIKCIECGKDISSFAPMCPHCGCPAEHQINEHLGDQHLDKRNDSSVSSVRLKNQEQWERIAELVKQKKTEEAQSMIEMIIGGGPKALAMLARVIRADGIPFDYILEKYPEQATSEPVAQSMPTTAPCSACGKTISAKAETCPYCGHPTGVHVCPRCGSTEIMWIDGVSKALSMAFFGPFSVNTVRNKYECEKCHFKF